MATHSHPDLTPGILDELRARLEESRKQLTAEVARRRGAEGVGDRPETDPNTEPRGDMADQSVDIQAWATNRQEDLDMTARLGDIEHALEKFALGTYGMCEGCGRPIPVARLRIIPEARFDVEHAQ